MGKRWSSAKRSDLRRDWQGFGDFHKKYFFEIGKVLNLLLHPGICESLSTLLGQRYHVDKEDVVLVLSRQRCQSLILALSQSFLSSLSFSLSLWILSCHCKGVKVSQSLLSPCNPSVASGSRSSNWDEKDQSC